MNCFLKQGLLEYPIIFYVRTYPCTMRGLQALIGFLDMEGLPRWGGPHEEEVTVIRVVIHKGIIWPEFSIGECPSDLGDDTWLGIDNIINQGHGTRSGFQGITYWYPWVFGFTSSIDYCGTSQINSPQGGGGFLILMRVWGIITLLVILMRYLNVKYKDLHLILSQEVLGGSQLWHVPPCDIGSYYICVQFLQFLGELWWDLSWS